MAGGAVGRLATAVAISRLTPRIQAYAWGSTTAIPSLLGVEPSGEPQAELWLGAHLAAPAVVDGDGTLADVVAADPQRSLGPEVARAYGGRLPFLLKVLAAAEPLSLQAHPSVAQAAEGFAREEAAGVPADDPRRVYRDENHKPELICALTPFSALCGFRDPRLSAALLEGLDVPELAPVVEMLSAGAEGLRDAVTHLLGRADASVVAEVAAACARPGGDARFAAERRSAVRLAEHYPGDAGVVVALLLNLVELAPGEAIELPAGNLHSYLEGVGVEIMASSDNVLRGGLTPKHVDVDELLAVLDTTPMEVARLRPRLVTPGVEVWDSAAAEFRLTRLSPAGVELEIEPHGPEIVLVTEGSLTVDDNEDRIDLARGQSVFVAGSTLSYRVTGDGVAYRATVGGPVA